MKALDWFVLIVTLLSIIGYGLYKSSTTKNLEGYFLSNRNMPWYLVLLSIMGTQASAITFLSAPGQAFTDGMRFVQYYLGLPLAMIILCITFVPLFSKLKVYTAYEYLEQRFDVKTRTFTSALFLVSRGLSTGISIYAPSIILSSLLGWDIYITNIVMGGLLIIYTVSGGAKAVAYTQQLQMVIIFTGMIIAGYYIVHYLPAEIHFSDALNISGGAGKMNIITTGITDNGFDWKDRYNIISGTLGGLFLALSYFGTDQSQVGRYLTAKTVAESKIGLLMNGLVKVPMQFFILLIGVLLFCFYQFKPQPIFFNAAAQEKALNTSFAPNLIAIQATYDSISKYKTIDAINYATAKKEQKVEVANTIRKNIIEREAQLSILKAKYKVIMLKANDKVDVNDTNYIFLRFVVDYLPSGLVGLLIAIIFLAAWGSIAAALNSLASCTMIDFYCRFKPQNGGVVNEKKEYTISKLFTLGWGIFCIIVAQFSNRMGSLIEAVNVLGSLFYGVILGIFLVAFYAKRIGANAVFAAAIIGEICVIGLFCLDKFNIIGLGFLWLNVVGALLVVMLAFIIQLLFPNKIALQMQAS